MATLAEYDDETGNLTLRLNEEHVEELRAVLRSELKESASTIEDLGKGEVSLGG